MIESGMSDYKTVTYPDTETNEAGEIYALMGHVMAEVGAIGKDSTNQQQNFKYRSIDAVYNALNPLLAKRGIFMAPCVLSKTREERTNSKGTVLAFTCLRIQYTFYAPDGSSVSCVVEGEGMDSGDKSSNKAMAVAHKYALLQTFCIPTEEQKDPDAEVHEVKAAPKKAPGRLTQESWEAMSRDQQDTLQDICAEVRSRLEEGNPEGAREVLELAGLEADEKVALWHLFSSQERSALKRKEEAA